METLFQGLGFALIFIVVSFLTNYINKKSKVTISSSDEEEIVLKYPRLLKYVGWGCITFMSLIALFGMFRDFGTETNIYGWLILPGMASILGVPLLLSAYNYKAIMDKQKIVVRDSILRTHEISFNEIEKISFDEILQYLTLTGKGKKVKIHYMLSGFQNLLNLLDEKLPQDMTEGAFTKIQKLRNRST